MELLHDLKMMFIRLTPDLVIEHELKEARLSLLRSETLREYADSQVAYNKNRVKRLSAYGTTTEEKS